MYKIKNLERWNSAYIIFVLTLLVFSIVITHNVVRWQNSEKNIPTIRSLGLITGDEPWILGETSAIVRHHTVYLDEFFFDKSPDPNIIFPQNFQVNDPLTNHAYKLDNGHYIIGDPLGPSYLLVPGYMIGGVFGAMMTVAVIMSLISITIYKIASNLSNDGIGFFTSLIFSFATLLFVYSNEIYPDVPISLLLIASIYFIFVKPQARFSLSIAGALLGAGFLFKPVIPVALLVILPVILYKVYRKQILVKNFIFFLGFLLLFILFTILNNLYVWGAWYGGGNTTAVVDLFRHGFIGHSGFFGDEGSYRLDAILESFFGRTHGLFIFSPVLLFSTLGAGILWKRNKLLFITIILVSVLIYTVYILTNPASVVMAGDPPFRFFLPLIPLMSIPFALGLHQYGKSILYRLALIITTIIGLAFSFSFGVNRIYSLANLDIKSEIIDKIYFGGSYFFTHLSPSYPVPGMSQKWDPHPLDVFNMLYITLIVGILIFCLVWSFKSNTIKSAPL